MNAPFPRLRAVMAAVLQVPEEAITPATGQSDIENWDSLVHLNLMLTLEEEFGLTLDVDDLTRLTSVQAILAFLDSNSHVVQD